MWRTFNICSDYLPGSIRARLGADEIPVEEIDPFAGTFRFDVSPDCCRELSVTFQRQLLTAGTPRPDQIVGTADACIYCGSRSNLQDEHIIAFGLEGEFILKKASCGDCAIKTSKLELAVLRDTLLPARTALNIRSRRKQKRPVTLPLVQVDKDGPVIRQVSVVEHPTYIALPLFDAAAVLRKADQPNIPVTGVWTRLVGASSLPQASSRFGNSQVKVQVGVDLYKFARMVGKIAHGFAAAADLGDVESNLPAAVLAEDESIGWWVGGAPNKTIKDEGLHGFGVYVIDGVVHVRVRLFAQLGGPEYLVVAGRLIDPSPNVRPSVTIESGSPRR